MRHLVRFVPALLLFGAAIPAAAQVGNPYLPPAPPAIVGTVTSSTSHSISVRSGEGESIRLVVDSRTLMPVPLAEGTRVRVEFHAMESGGYLAKRVTPLTSLEVQRLEESGTLRTHSRGRSEGTPATRQARAEHATAQPAGYAPAATTEQPSAAGGTATAVGATATGDEGGGNPLPGTASAQPLLALGGLIALAAGAGLLLSRRRARARR